MTPETDAVAREAVALAHGFGDQMTLARCKSGTTEQRQAAAAKAMMTLHMFERHAAQLKQLMPRSLEGGTALAKDLQEVSGR